MRLLHREIWYDVENSLYKGELTDPRPIDSNIHGKIGFEAYASWIAIKDIKVYRIEQKSFKNRYGREFA